MDLKNAFRSFVYLNAWVLFVSVMCINGDDQINEGTSAPSVTIVFLVRNKAHILPFFLYYLENLDYPKDKISLWIRSDHNLDDSDEIVQRWIDHVTSDYKDVIFLLDRKSKGYRFPDEDGPHHWSPQRYRHMIKLRQQALEEARRGKQEYILYVDCDNLLINTRVLWNLIEEKRPVVAPMFNVSATWYANFGDDYTKENFTSNSDEYFDIRYGHKLGSHLVPVVHSTILIDLKHSDTQNLGFYAPPDYNGPQSDIAIFAQNAKYYKVPLYVLNKDVYGYMQIPVKKTDSLQKERDQLAYLKTEAIFREAPLKSLDYIKEEEQTEVDNIGLDQIYVINLKRRPEKKQRMQQALKEHNMKAMYINAIDGKDLTEKYLKDHGIAVLPDYQDPLIERRMTQGEIGCFLSHYSIWKDVVGRKYKKVMVLEDDAQFKIYFRDKLAYVMNELERNNLEWDLIYLLRMPMDEETNNSVAGTYSLVWPKYSYLAVAYILSESGARKLMEQKPLSKILPVDEFFPIMYNEHPSRKWKSFFAPRNLVALATKPAIVQLGRRSGEAGYISDTEDSALVGQTEHSQDKGHGMGDEL